MTKLRRYLLIGTAVCIGAAAFFAQDAIAYVNAATRPTPPSVMTTPEKQAYIKHVPATMEASVRVELTNGMGSGVYVGNGFVVTAAHVVKDGGPIVVRTHDGKRGTATTLWASTDYDIALLRTDLNVPSADLDCRTARVGAQVMTIGNPLGMEFISSYGKIAGEPREFKGTWKSAFIADLTVIMGNSGGGVFSEEGRLVGIVVGVIGSGAEGKSYLGLSTIVPSSDVCSLLGRVK